MIWWLISRILFTLVCALAVIVSLFLPIVILYAYIKLVITGVYWECSITKVFPTIEDGEIRIWNMSIPIKQWEFEVWG